MGGDPQRRRLAAEEVAHDAVVHRLGEVEPPIHRQRAAPGRVPRLDAEIVAFQHDLGTAGQHLDGGVDVAVDGGVHHRAAVPVTIGRHVGSAAGEAEAQRRAGAHGGGEGARAEGPNVAGHIGSRISGHVGAGRGRGEKHRCVPMAWRRLAD